MLVLRCNGVGSILVHYIIYTSYSMSIQIGLHTKVKTFFIRLLHRYIWYLYLHLCGWGNCNDRERQLKKAIEQ